jgi:methylmalonyl-CoA/ethylmalonyl-CoA epimerase
MIKKVTHIGIAVKDLAEASRRFQQLLGKSAARGESVTSEKVNVAIFDLDGTKVELTEAADPSSVIARFIEKRGEGVHHISLEVETLEEELTRLRKEGFEVLDGYPRAGADGCRVAFLHPRTTHGVLIELSEKGY